MFVESHAVTCERCRNGSAVPLRLRGRGALDSSAHVGVKPLKSFRRCDWHFELTSKTRLRLELPANRGTLLLDFDDARSDVGDRRRGSLARKLRGEILERFDNILHSVISKHAVIRVDRAGQLDRVGAVRNVL